MAYAVQPANVAAPAGAALATLSERSGDDAVAPPAAVIAGALNQLNTEDAIAAGDAKARAAAAVARLDVAPGLEELEMAPPACRSTTSA